MSELALSDRRLSLPWPLPALLTWLLAWTLWAASQGLGLLPEAAFALATCVGLASAVASSGRWRRGLVAMGFPLSALATGAALPAWGWLLALAPLLLAYPLRAWTDAPFFPTPAHALEGLDAVMSPAPGARVLDAGCGIGHGLAALRRLWPEAQLQGIEWSHPLTWLAARRCPWARLVQGDMWAMGWSGFDVVYLFQRPESMGRAWAKAEAEMAPGSWLVSLEFAVPGRAATARLGGESRRAVWVYRIPTLASIQPHSRR